MSKGKHSEAEMIGALKQMEAGRTAADIARELASRSTPSMPEGNRGTQGRNAGNAGERRDRRDVFNAGTDGTFSDSLS